MPSRKGGQKWARRRAKSYAPRQHAQKQRPPEPPLEPVVQTCPAHLLPEPCHLCLAYIAAGL